MYNIPQSQNHYLELFYQKIIFLKKATAKIQDALLNKLK